MQFFANRVRFATTTTGTGTVTAGAAASGYRTPSSAGLVDGAIVRYFIESGADWETGIGVIGSSATTMTRELTESSTGSLLVLGGSATVFLDLAEQHIPVVWPARAYGALPTNTAAANATALQNVIDACAAGGGGIVDVDDGTIQYSTGLNVTSSKVYIRGRGKATNLQYTGSGIGISYFGGIDSCKISDILLSATNDAATIVQISSFNQSFFFDDVFFADGGTHIQLTSATTTTGGAYGIHIRGGNSSGAAIRVLDIAPGGALVGLDQAIFVSDFDADGYNQFLKCTGLGNGINFHNCRVERHIGSTTSPFDIAYTSKFMWSGGYIEDDCTVPLFALGTNVRGFTLMGAHLAPNVDGGSNLNATVLKTSTDAGSIHILYNHIGWGGTVGNLFDTGGSPIVAIGNDFTDGTAEWGFATTAAAKDRFFAGNTASGAVFTNSAGVLVQLGGTALVGTTTNDDAAAGYVGEYLSSTVLVGSAVSLANATAKNVTSITLTPGDWDVTGLIYYFPSGTTVISNGDVSLSTTSNTLDVSPGRFTNYTTAGFTPGNTVVGAPPVPAARFSVAVNTIVYLVAFSVFNSGANSAYGMISARRVR